MKLKCSKHPKYKGRKMPDYKIPCTECLSIYLTLKNKPRMPHKPTRVIPDKTKYNRKKKHKEEE